MPPALYAISRLRKLVDVIVCIKVELALDFRYRADDSCGNHALAT